MMLRPSVFGLFYVYVHMLNDSDHLLVKEVLDLPSLAIGAQRSTEGPSHILQCR